jgi:hypothetical protein
MLKARDPRRKVVLDARMRVGTCWKDVCILNISSRGLLLQAAVPPARGSYLELRRGRHIMLARVVWADNRRCGLRTQDLLPVEEIVSERESPPAQSGTPTAPATFVDRRSSPREREVRHENSRMLSRAIEFCTITVFAASAAVAAYGTLEQSLSRPLASASAALTRN